MVSKENISYKVFTQEDSEKTLSNNILWSLPVPYFSSPKSNLVTNIKVASITSERVYEGLKYECDLFLLTPENWKQVFDYVDIDFFLIESFWETVTGHWYLAQMHNGKEKKILEEIISYCKEKNVPSIYWNTQDKAYSEYFSTISKKCDHIFCSDTYVVEKFRKEGVSANILLPAIQPAIHNPFKNYDDANTYKIDILYDGLADILRLSDQLTFLNKLQGMGLSIIESQYRLFKSKLEDISKYKNNTLGAVTQRTRLMALKYTSIYVTSSQTISTPVRQQWLSLEAAACRVPILHKGQLNSIDFRSKFVECFNDDDDLVSRADTLLNNKLQREKSAHIAWRHANQNHTYSHRMRAICDKIRLKHEWEEYPLTSITIATFRLNLLSVCIKKFEEQTYPNKELVLVINSNDYTQEEALKLIKGKENIRIYILPSERVEGGCLNFAISASKGVYCIKMDDDDHYSKDFVMDMILHERAIDADVFGKGNSFIHFEDDNTTYERNSRPPLTIIPKSKMLQAHISGNSLSGKREFLLKHFYSDKNIASTDTCFHGNIENHPGTYALLDSLGLIMERSSDVSQHSWRLSSEDIKKKMTFMANGISPDIII